MVADGLSLPYSSGTVEEHNNKIKMLKRQMWASLVAVADHVGELARGKRSW
ncbi:hypothetical protein [Streptomyces sp. NPDC026673]|uniref:hypothetical protein n=1 Tax=Streptomyces sp. NPDC026673 TaxID=3155724 RepID=UPI003403BE69